jgi:hypothetical protein
LLAEDKYIFYKASRFLTFILPFQNNSSVKKQKADGTGCLFFREMRLSLPVGMWLMRLLQILPPK